jgi:hypothetical protein
MAAAHKMLSRTDQVSSAQSEAIELLAGYLEQIQSTSDSTRLARTLRLARQTLIHDLGAFSLFRPRLHLVWDWPLIGAGFGPRGQPNLDSARVLRLPKAFGGESTQ